MKQNIAQLYDAIDVGIAGELVYNPVKVAVTDEGTIYLEVDPDVYGKAGDLMAEVAKQCRNLSVTGKVDWDKAREIIHDLTGNAEYIGNHPTCRIINALCFRLTLAVNRVCQIPNFSVDHFRGAGQNTGCKFMYC